MPPKNILIACYYFPPLGLAGTARPLAMANHLAEQGHRVTVLTVRDIDYPVYDRRLANQISGKVTVVRAESRDPARLRKRLPLIPSRKLLGRALSRKVKELHFPDSKVGFVRPAFKELEKLLPADGDNILITTSPPVSIHQLGLKARERYQFKWVADWRDIWEALPHFEQSRNFSRKAVEYTQRVLRAADLVTATSAKTLEYFEDNLKIAANYFFLPNGYNETDFEGQLQREAGRIGLYGTLNHLVGIDRLFSWIDQFRKRYPEIKFSIRHTGHNDLRDFESLLARYNLTDIFSSDGYIPHYRGAIAIMRANSVNLIALSTLCDTSFIVPSKLFELLRAEPPLIALLPENNAARDLLNRYNFEGLTLVNNIERFHQALKDCLSAGDSSKHRQRRGVEVFDRRNQMRRLNDKLIAL